MDSYVAVIRLKRCGAHQGLPARLEGLLAALRGIAGLEIDAPAGALSVTFDRATVSLGDLVRTLEDGGVGVAAVAQCRDNRSAAQAQAATA